jgi:hypothetical protein
MIEEIRIAAPPALYGAFDDTPFKMFGKVQQKAPDRLAVT